MSCVLRIRFRFLVAFILIFSLCFPLEPAKKKIYIIKHGYLNKEGKVVIPLQFEIAKRFYKGLALVRVDGKWGYIDKTGKFVIEPKLDEAPEYLRQGLNPVKISGNWGYIDRAGNIVIAPKFNVAKQFSEGLATVSTGGKWGFIDRTGKFVIEPELHGLPGSFSEGLASFSKGHYVDAKEKKKKKKK